MFSCEKTNRENTTPHQNTPPLTLTQLAYLHAELLATSIPVPDPDGALEMLRWGRYRRLPLSLAALAPAPPPPPSARDAAAARMGRLVRGRLLGGDLPPGVGVAGVAAGVATLRPSGGGGGGNEQQWYACRVTLAPPPTADDADSGVSPLPASDDATRWRWRVVEASVLPGYSPSGAPPPPAPARGHAARGGADARRHRQAEGGAGGGGVGSGGAGQGGEGGG